MEPSSTTTPALRRDGKSLSEVAGDPTALARRLNVEFSAPVGLYDPKGGDWAVRIGAPPELFPSITPTVSVAVGDEARVMILGGDRGSEALWLLLPVDCELHGYRVRGPLQRLEVDEKLVGAGLGRTNG